MLVLGFEAECFQPCFKLMSVFVALRFVVQPFRATVLDVGVTVVLVLFDFAFELLERVDDLFDLLRVVFVASFPLLTSVADDFFSGCSLASGSGRESEGEGDSQQGESKHSAKSVSGVDSGMQWPEQ